MRHSLQNLSAMLSTPLGRFQILYVLYRGAWPLLSRLASLYRHTICRNTRIVAVVGSFGKSTTTRAVISALGKRYHPSFQRNAWSSVARAVLRIRPFARHSVIEVGIDRPGQMEAYAQLIQPNITIVTSIGSEHLSSMGTLEVTRAEKSKMVKALSASGIAVLNGDDSNVLWMKDQTHARVVTFGVNQNNDVRATDIHLDWPSGTRFKLHTAGETRDLHIRLIGKHMVYSILAAVAVALAEGFDLDKAIRGLEAMPPTSGRLQPIQLANGAFILRDEYKSSWETVVSALDAFSEVPAERRIAVLGEVSEPPGSQGPIYRQLGERIAKIVSYAIFLGGNYQRYAAGATHGGLTRDALFNAGRSPLKAVEELRRHLRPGDVVLIKGRDTERLDRVALALMGRTVRCDISFCNVKLRCEHCPMLERGWGNQKTVM